MGESGPAPAVRVLHLTSSLNVGGAERLLVDLLTNNAARDTGAELSYVVMNDLIDPALRGELEASGAEGCFLGRREGDKSPRYLRRLSAIVRERRIDIVHTHTTGSKYWAYLLKLLHPRLKLFYTIHSTFDVVCYKALPLALHRRLVAMNIAISKAVLAQCGQMGLPRATLVYNGVNIEQYPFRPWRPPAGGPRLVCVSRLVPRIKGQDLIIDAVRICRDRGLELSVDLVGDTSGDAATAAAALKAQAAALGLPAGAVNLLGLSRDVPGLLPGYDGYLCGSRKEGLGLSLVEAMLAGLPVIAPDTDGPAELVDHGRTGFLYAAGSAEGMAEAIMEVYGAGMNLAPVTLHAREFALGFGITHMTDSYAAAYRRVI